MFGAGDRANAENGLGSILDVELVVGVAVAFPEEYLSALRDEDGSAEAASLRVYVQVFVGFCRNIVLRERSAACQQK